MSPRHKVRSMPARRLRPPCRTWLSGRRLRMKSTTLHSFNSSWRCSLLRLQTVLILGIPTCPRTRSPMQQTLRTKLLIGILAALTVIGGVLAHELQVSKETATSTAKTAAEREKAEQIDRDDKAAIQKIRERNAQKANTAPNQ